MAGENTGNTVGKIVGQASASNVKASEANPPLSVDTQETPSFWERMRAIDEARMQAELEANKQLLPLVTGVGQGIVNLPGDIGELLMTAGKSHAIREFDANSRLFDILNMEEHANASRDIANALREDNFPSEIADKIRLKAENPAEEAGQIIGSLISPTIAVKVFPLFLKLVQKAKGLATGGRVTKTVTVYRVEGAPNTRVIIGEHGQVIITGDTTLYLNFGDKARALEFLEKRIVQNMEGATIKTFEVPKSVLDELRRTAVKENVARSPGNVGKPIIADPTKAKDQYGIRPDKLKELQDKVIQGSGKDANKK